MTIGRQRHCVTPACLRSVFFRRPVFLRDYGDDSQSPDERFSRIQWAAFLRNLMLFREACWVNDPTATYKAEHKAVQLSLAAEIGFSVPDTRITNSPHPNCLGNDCDEVAVKGLDTVLLRYGGREMFGFTTFCSRHELEPLVWQSAPATIQAALIDKVDIRVTVVEDQVFAASITTGGKPVSGDWRCNKRDVEFKNIELPSPTETLCREIVRKLGLRFGGVDLALCDGKYFFLEINPTGEWAWLVDSAGLPIDEAIADVLAREVHSDV
ncbi:RimK-like ATP-grasp domain protein [Symmachiella dynata]|uniref:RimK-like ATP-grasp domain protein n=1 Tax=Symmachiella dynata TaxID=2527995 RepID=A0A517ZPF2_9PLAN|nr:hypothetical protein [Symmachiella dynata]QDU44321.1 RimK-like ATP-grasp domain protein [Symmachiella dynata]